MPVPLSGAPVTDAAVPEGHKGLHSFLYGSGGAEEHERQGNGYNLRKVCVLGGARRVWRPCAGRCKVAHGGM